LQSCGITHYSILKKVTSPSHIFNPNQVYILASDVEPKGVKVSINIL